MKDNNTYHSINDIYNQLNHKADVIYKFALLYNDFISEKNDYGTGESVTMVEVHTLTTIEEYPGITISELAESCNRTKGAISQIASKLKGKGLIKKSQINGNEKNVHLFATEKGITLSQKHKTYDSREVSKTIDLLLEKYTIQEIDAFFKVAEGYIKLLTAE